MSPAPQIAFESKLALRRVHRALLAFLVLCALAIAATGSAEGSGTVDLRYTLAAIALAGASILTRRVTRTDAPSPWHARLSLASLLLAGAIGVVGAALAASGGPRRTALLYVLGSAILSLRSPLAAAARGPGRGRA